jgi:hypothetical protein
MSDFVGIDVQGIDQVDKLLKSIPPDAQDAVVDDVSQYMVRSLRLNPPEKRVKRKAAYGETFFTDKQRRFFFAALADGRINVPYDRTQQQSNGWEIIGKGKNAIVANQVPSVIFTRDNERQSRLSKLIGWKTVGDEIKDRMDKILYTANEAVKRVLKKAK